MATETILIKIEGDPKGARATLDVLKEIGEVDAKNAKQFESNARKVNRGQKRTKGLIEDTEDALKALRKARDKSQDTKSIEKFNRKIKEAEFDLKKLKTAGTSTFKKIGKEIDKTKNKASSFNKNLLKVGGAIAGVFAVGRVIAFAKESIKAFDKQQKAEKRLLTALLGREDVQEALLKQAKEFQDTTIFADEDVIAAQSLIAAFTDEQEVIEELTRVTLDFATAKGFALPAAAELVSKTFASSTNSLTRYGIQVTGAANSTERLESITKNLDAAFKGQAAAAVTGAGKLQQLGNLMGDVKENFGRFLVEGLSPITDGLTSMVQSLLDSTKSTAELAQETATATNAFDNQKEEVEVLVKRYDELKGQSELNKDEQTELKDIIVKLAEVVPTAVTEFNKFGEALDINTQAVMDNLNQQQELVRLRSAEAIDEVTDSMLLQWRQLGLLNERLRTQTKEVTIVQEKGADYTKTVKLTGEEITETANKVKVLNADLADNLLALQNLGVELTSGQKKFIGASTGVETFTKKVVVSTKKVEKAAKEVDEPFREFIEIIESGENPSKEFADEIERIAQAVRDLNRATSQAEVDILFPEEITDDEAFTKLQKSKTNIQKEEEAERKRIFDQTVNSSIDAGNKAFDVINALNRKQTIELENEHRKRLRSLEKQLRNGTISEEEFAERSAVIDEKSNKKRRELMRKQAITDKATAIFQATIATAAAVTAALEIPPLAIAIGILGAAEIAVIAATPIPKYEKGTKDAPGGFGIVGEKGKETTFLQKGTKVIPADRSKKYASAIDAMIDNNFDKWVMNNYLEPSFGANVSRSLEYNFDTDPITHRQNKGNKLMKENNYLLRQLTSRPKYYRNGW